MTNQSEKKETIELDLSRLAREVRRLPQRKSGGPVDTPRELRRRAVELWDRSGLSSAAFCRRVGIGSGSLGNWSAARARKDRPTLRIRPKLKSKLRKPNPVKAPFREIKVVPGKSHSFEDGVRRDIVLELDRGARVSGLTISDIAKLIGALGEAV
jgi:hypothetical protein